MSEKKDAPKTRVANFSDDDVRVIAEALQDYADARRCLIEEINAHPHTAECANCKAAVERVNAEMCAALRTLDKLVNAPVLSS